VFQIQTSAPRAPAYSFIRHDNGKAVNSKSLPTHVAQDPRSMCGALRLTKCFVTLPEALHGNLHTTISRCYRLHNRLHYTRG